MLEWSCKFAYNCGELSPLQLFFPKRRTIKFTHFPAVKSAVCVCCIVRLFDSDRDRILYHEQLNTSNNNNNNERISRAPFHFETHSNRCKYKNTTHM